MTNWEDANEYCTAGRDFVDARRVCGDLGIPLHHVNFAQEYRQEVFAAFLLELEAGRTPNPDVACNRLIKFGVFLDHATRLGADCIATGHYARVEGGAPRLMRPVDRHKDQTYFLHAIQPSALARTLFPLGELQKSEVRRLARDYGLSNHAKRDSTGICFVGERPFRDFLAEHMSPLPGPILTGTGEQVGDHSGLPFYTLGQREGLKIGGRNDSLQAPWFVARKDLSRNALIVVQGRDHPLVTAAGTAGGRPALVAGEPSGLIPGLTLEARIRHRHMPARCQVQQLPGGTLQVRFHEPQRSPTPGQYVVFYQGDECLGGGVILDAFPEALGSLC